jgi:hypothetical protein
VGEQEEQGPVRAQALASALALAYHLALVHPGRVVSALALEALGVQKVHH